MLAWLSDCASGRKGETNLGNGAWAIRDGERCGFSHSI
jgi:hypothetical protein